jgi:hypothetical protein
LLSDTKTRQLRPMFRATSTWLIRPRLSSITKLWSRWVTQESVCPRLFSCNSCSSFKMSVGQYGVATKRLDSFVTHQWIATHLLAPRALVLISLTTTSILFSETLHPVTLKYPCFL